MSNSIGLPPASSEDLSALSLQAEAFLRKSSGVGIDGSANRVDFYHGASIITDIRKAFELGTMTPEMVNQLKEYWSAILKRIQNTDEYAALAEDLDALVLQAEAFLRKSSEVGIDGSANRVNFDRGTSIITDIRKAFELGTMTPEMVNQLKEYWSAILKRIQNTDEYAALAAE